MRNDDHKPNAAMLSGMSDLRSFNRGCVLNEIHRGEGPSRIEVAERVGLSQMAITRIARELLEAGLIEEGDKAVRPNSPGRRRTELTIKPNGAYAVGLSLSAYNQAIALVDLAGNVHAAATLDLSDLRDAPLCLQECASAINVLIAEAGVERHRVAGVGVAIAGKIDSARGVVLDTSYLAWGRTDVAAALGQSLRLPVIVENISAALLQAEVKFGVAQDKSNALLFRNSISLGGSVLLGGRLMESAHLHAGAIGHVPVKGAARQCPCGQVGCLNTVASGWAVLADLGETNAPVLSASQYQRNRKRLMRAIRRAASGDQRAHAALMRAGRYLGEALLPLRGMLLPEMIVLSGPLGSAPAYLEGVRSGLWPSVSRGDGEAAILAISQIDDHRAAALRALSEFVLSPRLDIRRLTAADEEASQSQAA